MTVSSNDQIPVAPMKELLVATMSKPGKLKIRLGWLVVLIAAVLMWIVIIQIVLNVF